MTHALVVEDEPDVRAVLADMLEFEGYRVSTARDGMQALSLARADPPAVIVLDMLLPGTSGQDVARACQTDPCLRAIPIVALSAFWGVMVPHPPAAGNVRATLRKPFDLAALLAAVRACLPPEASAPRP